MIQQQFKICSKIYKIEMPYHREDEETNTQRFHFYFTQTKYQTHFKYQNTEKAQIQNSPDQKTHVKTPFEQGGKSHNTHKRELKEPGDA